MDDKTLISSLLASYRRQLVLYKNLTAIVQKTLSQVVLTRGDVSGLKTSFEKKQLILDDIVKERTASEECVKLWQVRKNGIAQSAQSKELDSVLQATQSAIGEFLEAEEQLKKYLEHVVKKGAAVS